MQAMNVFRPLKVSAGNHADTTHLIHLEHTPKKAGRATKIQAWKTRECVCVFNECTCERDLSFLQELPNHIL